MSELKAKITKILKDNNHPNPEFWLDDPNIKNVDGVDGAIERVYVNRYWRSWLHKLPIDTSSYRFFLDDKESEESYLQYFTNMIVPLIIQYSEVK